MYCPLVIVFICIWSLYLMHLFSTLINVLLCISRHISCYFTICQDEAITHCRSALIQTQEPLDAIITAEEGLKNVVILDSSRFIPAAEVKIVVVTDLHHHYLYFYHCSHDHRKERHHMTPLNLSCSTKIRANACLIS